MAEKNLAILLSSMNPRLDDNDFVFATIEESEFASKNITPLCTFREQEGLSLIVEKSIADKASINYTGLWSLITCKVNSDLNAVGFLAAISNTLASAGIPCNAVSAYFHDHLFVPKDKSLESMSILQNLAASGNFKD